MSQTWADVVPDTQAPTATFSPADESTDVAVNTTLTMTFDENVQKGTGNVYVKKSSDNSILYTVDVTTASVSVTDATATITLPGNLDDSTSYYIQVDAGAFKDMVDNDYAGIADNTTWNFTTVTPDVTAPSWTATYPKTANVANNDFDLLVSIDETGKAYYVVLADSSATPNASEVKDATAAGLVKSGSIDITTASTEFTTNISGLTAGTVYDVYVVAEDNEPNLQASATEIADVTTTSIMPEPANHATGFATSDVTGTSAKLDWVDAVAGVQAPENYVIVINTSGTFTVADGTPIVDDTDFSDGAGAINIAYGVQTCTLNTLAAGQTYTARIYPYTNSGASINFKTDETIPETSINTPSITVTQPNGGESYNAGDPVTITWTSVNMDAENVKIEAYIIDDATWKWLEIEPGTENDGSYDFTIPADSRYGTGYKIRITGLSSGATDESDAPFTIVGSTSIYEIESRTTTEGASIFDGLVVRTHGIVTAVTSKNYYLQDGSGDYNGIYVYYNTTHSYAMGDSLTIIGEADEYNNLTQIKSITSTTLNSSGNTLPAAADLSTANVQKEEYENVLVKVSNATCTGSNKVDDGSGELTVYSSLYSGLSLTTGRKYNITGVVTWYNAGSIYELLPRSADDVYLISNDSTLSAFTVGGENVMGLGGILVTDPDTEDGATLYVADFSGFVGVSATATDTKATVSIFKNGGLVDPADYSTLTLADGDIIVAKVTAEDGTLGYYKVTLVGENRTLSVTAPVGGETYHTGDVAHITWTSANITNVNIWAYNAVDDELYPMNETPVNATLGTFDYTILNGDAGVVYIRVTDASDANFYGQSAGSVTVIDNAVPAITGRYPGVSATGIATAFTLSITFDEDVNMGTGNLKVFKADDNTEVASFAAADVTIMDDVVTCPVSGLSNETTYYVTVDAGMFKDHSDNGTAAIAANEWAFTTKAFVQGSLFFSEYIEGSSNNKALEIYNGTGAAVDLSNYVIRINANGGTWTSHFDFPARTLADGDVYVIAHAEANSSILTVADTAVVNPYSGGTSYVAVFNGDDVRALCKVNGNDTTIIDIIGRYDQVDPGTGWAVAGIADATSNHTLIRKSSIYTGNTDWDASAGTTTDNSEWKVKDVDYTDNLGSHTVGLSSEAQILAFVLAEQTGNAEINSAASTVNIEVLYGTDATSLTPTITVSEGASISPNTGVTQDFTNPVVYTVTAEDGTIKDWTVTVSVSATQSSEKDILSFSIPNQLSADIDANAATVSVIMPNETALTNLTPTITVSLGASIDPASGIAGNFSNPVEYTVTAQDASTKVWTVTVTEQQVSMVTIHDIQYTTAGDSPYKDQPVTTSGIVTAIKLGTSGTQQGFYLQDGTGEWNGLYVYSSTPTVAQGDNVTLSGTIEEYNGLTEMTTITASTTNSSGNTLPAAASVTTLGACTEAYESVLVKVTNANCASGGSGSFVVNDGSGDLTVYKSLYAELTLTIGTHYNITGVMTWYNSGSIFELYPRNANDIEIADAAPVNTFANFKVFPNPFSNEIRFEGSDVTRITITSIIGQVVMDVQTSGTNAVNTSNLVRGIYLVKFTNNKGESTLRKLIKE